MLSAVNSLNLVPIGFFCNFLYIELLKLSKTAKYQKVVQNKLFLMTKTKFKKMKLIGPKCSLFRIF